MANQSGFQSNTTVTSAFWWFKPDPSIVPPGKEIFVEVNNVQYIETVTDHSRCWIYYAATDVSTSQRAYILEGDAAVAFVADMEALFA